MAASSSQLLGALGQPRALLDPVRKYTMLMAIAFPAIWLSSAISTVLASQDLQLPGLVAQLLSAFINFTLSWVFLANGVGFLGVAAGCLLGSWASALYLILYVVVTGKQGMVWRIPDELSIAGRMSFSSYLKSALPSAMSMWCEWWAAEILAVFAGLLPGGEASVAANGLLFNTLAIFYMVFVAVARAASMRVSFFLGAKDARGIRMSLIVALCITVLLSGVVAVTLQVLGPTILSFYTTDEGILSEGNQANLGMVLSVPSYSVMMCLLGAMRSLGLQSWALLAVAVAFYVTGIPMGYYLGLIADVGLLGIWMGNVIALTVAAILMSAKMLTVDLDALALGSAMGEQPKLNIPLLKGDEADMTIDEVLASTPTSVSLAGVTRGASFRIYEPTETAISP